MTDKAHNHYYKNVSHLEYIDVYRVLELFNVTDPCLQHAMKKLLVAGGRGHKDISRDIQDVIDSCVRWQEMQRENNIKSINITNINVPTKTWKVDGNTIAYYNNATMQPENGVNIDASSPSVSFPDLPDVTGDGKYEYRPSH